MLDPIDAYCERTSAAYWAEPVNAVTNLAFLLAAHFFFGRKLRIVAWVATTVHTRQINSTFYPLPAERVAELNLGQEGPWCSRMLIHDSI